MDAGQSLEKVDQFLEAATALLQHYERQMDSVVEKAQQQLDVSVSQQKKEMTEFVRENIKTELGSVLKGYTADMEENRQKMIAQTAELNIYLHHVNKKNRQLSFRSWLAVLLSLITLLVGVIGLAYYYSQIIVRNKLDAETAQLIGQSDIVRCGEALCVKTGKVQQNGYRVVLKR